MCFRKWPLFENYVLILGGGIPDAILKSWRHDASMYFMHFYSCGWYPVRSNIEPTTKESPCKVYLETQKGTTQHNNKQNHAFLAYGQCIARLAHGQCSFVSTLESLGSSHRIQVLRVRQRSRLVRRAGDESRGHGVDGYLGGSMGVALVLIHL